MSTFREVESSLTSPFGPWTIRGFIPPISCWDQIESTQALSRQASTAQVRMDSPVRWTPATSAGRPSASRSRLVPLSTETAGCVRGTVGAQERPGGNVEASTAAPSSTVEIASARHVCRVRRIIAQLLRAWHFRRDPMESSRFRIWFQLGGECAAFLPPRLPSRWKLARPPGSPELQPSEQQHHRKRDGIDGPSLPGADDAIGPHPVNQGIQGKVKGHRPMKPAAELSPACAPQKDKAEREDHGSELLQEMPEEGVQCFSCQEL